MAAAGREVRGQPAPWRIRRCHHSWPGEPSGVTEILPEKAASCPPRPQRRHSQEEGLGLPCVEPQTPAFTALIGSPSTPPPCSTGVVILLLTDETKGQSGPGHTARRVTEFKPRGPTPSRPPSFRPLEGEAGKKGAGLGQGSRKRGGRLRVQRALPPARGRRSSFLPCLCSGALGAADRAPDGGPCPQLGSVGVLVPSSTPGTGVACARPPRPSKAPGPWGGAGQVPRNRLRQWQGDGWRWGHPT